MPEDPEEFTSAHLLFALIGAALCLVAGFLMVASLIVVPIWVVAVLLVVWMVTVGYAIRRWRQNQFAPLLAGVISLGAWVISVGVADGAFELWG
jgi:uncharacterized protein YacL